MNGVDQWEQKLVRMQKLSRGWDGYDAEPPETIAIRAAKRFVFAMLTRNLSPARVAPSVVGGVGVTAKSGARRVYVEFYNDGNIHAIFYGGEVGTMPVTDTDDGFANFIERMKAYLNS